MASVNFINLNSCVGYLLGGYLLLWL